MGDVLEFKSRTTELEGPLTAFYFSRKPRAERIAVTLDAIFKAIPHESEDAAFLLAVGVSLEPYALKDFAVRYGHLEDGHAQP